MLKQKPSSAQERGPQARLPFLDRPVEKRRKGLFFQPEAKTYRWVAPRAK